MWFYVFLLLLIGFFLTNSHPPTHTHTHTSNCAIIIINYRMNSYIYDKNTLKMIKVTGNSYFKTIIRLIENFSLLNHCHLITHTHTHIYHIISDQIVDWLINPIRWKINRKNFFLFIATTMTNIFDIWNFIIWTRKKKLSSIYNNRVCVFFSRFLIEICPFFLFFICFRVFSVFFFSLFAYSLITVIACYTYTLMYLSRDI